MSGCYSKKSIARQLPTAYTRIFVQKYMAVELHVLLREITKQAWFMH
jgi:hypothetical protein